ncbi:MAG: 30S ribosomal protein S20 [Acidobacteriia bacterium]|nr:30S ribosomal protein S20 [Terriglobia bacterium]
MANHKSAEKRARQSERKRIANKSKLNRLRTHLKKMNSAIEEKNTVEIKRLLPATLSLIDQSCHGNTLHRNTASRKKSRLMAKVNNITPVETSPS